MEAEQLCFEDVAVGDELPVLVRQPTPVQMFMFSAITWNRHRIHYDKDWAQHEGYPNIVVQGTLHGNLLCQLLTDWIGPQGFIKKFSYGNRRPAFVGDTLTVKGRVKNKYTEGDDHCVECEIWTEKQNGEMTAPGSAIVTLPARK